MFRDYLSRQARRSCRVSVGRAQADARKLLNVLRAIKSRQVLNAKLPAIARIAAACCQSTPRAPVLGTLTFTGEAHSPQTHFVQDDTAQPNRGRGLWLTAKLWQALSRHLEQQVESLINSRLSKHARDSRQ